MARKNEQKPSKIRKLINEAYEQNELDSLLSINNRARSITVGTAFGGICEVSLRTEKSVIYAQMQPTEVVELIEQLASGIGVDVAMRPKQNFASWRGWEEVIDQRIGWDKIAWKGAAAWQLNGDNLEKNAQLQLKPISSSQEESEKAIEGSKEQPLEIGQTKKPKKASRTKTTTTDEKVNE